MFYLSVQVIYLPTKKVYLFDRQFLKRIVCVQSFSLKIVFFHEIS